MIKSIFPAIVFCLMVSMSMAQGKVIHDDNAQTRQVANFHSISVATGIHLYLTQGSEEAVAVSASQPAYRDRIKTEVEDGVLKIYYDYHDLSHWNTSGKGLKVYVSFKSLDALKATSGSQVEVDGTVRSETLDLSFSSGASFSGKVQVTKLGVDQSSGSTSTISGTTVNLKAETTSGSVLHGSDLQADQCEAKANSGGGIDISVMKELSASAHSGGYVNYRGSGVVTTINTGSGGSVSKR